MTPRPSTQTRTSYEVGKFYMVPCVKVMRSLCSMRPHWLPIIGPQHSDAEIIKFDAPHWHIDWRFVAAKQFHSAESVGIFPPGHCYAVTAQPWNWHDKPYRENNLLEGQTPRRMKCKRDWPAYPEFVPRRRVQWLPDLRAAFKDCTLKPGLICPHKGIPLEGCPQDGDVVTCPGHGLRWNVKTGALVTGESPNAKPLLAESTAK